jgi:hypothetical protein
VRGGWFTWAVCGGRKNSGAGGDRGLDRSWRLLRGGGGKTSFSFGPRQREDKGARGRRTWRRQGTRSGAGWQPAWRGGDRAMPTWPRVRT